MKSRLRDVGGGTCYATTPLRHLFPARFFVGTSGGAVAEIHLGTSTAQFVPTLPHEAGLSIERPANICLSIRQFLALAGRLRINGLHCFCETADWFAKLRAEYGIDMRAPAFDRRLFELCIGIPEDQYLRKGCQRWLIKRAMQGRLPDIVLSNTRTGAQAADWFVRLTRERKQITAELNRLTGNPEVSSIIDLQRLIRVVDHWPERQPETFSAERTPAIVGSTGSWSRKFHRDRDRRELSLNFGCCPFLCAG